MERLHDLLVSRGVAQPDEITHALSVSGSFVVCDITAGLPIIYVSDGFTQLAGYERSEIEGRNCKFLQGTNTRPADVDKVREIIKNAIGGGEGGAVQLTNYTKSGQEFQNMFYLAPLRNQGGQSVLLLGAQCDVSHLTVLHGDATPAASMCLVNRSTPPNTKVLSFSNEFASGKVLVKTRTEPAHPNVRQYFAGRNRMFEIQTQFRLLKPIAPGETLFLGAEVRDPLKVGLGTRMVCSTILSVLKMFNKTLHHSFGTEVETAHLVFPFEVLPDNLWVTPEGQEAPHLSFNDIDGGDKSAVEKLTPGVTYTLRFYSQFIDFEKWTITKLPGLKDVDLARFWGQNSLHVIAYSLPRSSASNKKPHLKAERNVLFDIEISHQRFTT